MMLKPLSLPLVAPLPPNYMEQHVRNVHIKMDSDSKQSMSNNSGNILTSVTHASAEYVSGTINVDTGAKEF
jgi:hypothetical protein